MARSLDELLRQYKSTNVGPQRGPGGHGGPGPGRGRGRGKGPGMKGPKPKDMKPTIMRIWSYIRQYKFRLILVMAVMLISTVASLAGAALLRPLINSIADSATPAADRLAHLGKMLILIGCIYLAQSAGQYLQSRMMIGISQTTIERIRNDLFHKMEGLPIRFYDNHVNGELMSRFTNDVDNIGIMLDQTLTGLVSGAVTLVGTFAIMCYTNIWLTLITVVFIPVFAKGGAWLGKMSHKYSKAQQEALGSVNGYIEESVGGQKVVKVFNHEATCVEEFGLLNSDLRNKQIKAMFFGGIMGPVMGNTSKISYSLTAGIGGVLCALGKFDIGGLAVFVNYAQQFSRPINEISQQMATVFSALAGAERVFQIMDSEPEAPNAENAFDPEHIDGHVILDHVDFGYVPGKTVLSDISLYAKPGQKIAFVGSTGAGKTTITNLLNRFYDIDSGSITIDGVNIRDYDRATLRRNISMVLQDTHLFTGTVMENIRYGRLDASDEEVIAAAKMASADPFIMRLEKGYDTMIEGDGANLSQGQRQLLNIARAALSNAPILVLDEATSSVDTRTERLIELGMDKLMENRTTFVIAHRLSTVRNSNAIMVLENGRIIERGDHDDLLAMKGRYYELYMGKSELT